MEKDKDGFPITFLREFRILMNCQHKNIVSVKEIVMGRSPSHIYIVMEYLDHDLLDIFENTRDQSLPPYSAAEIKCLMLQLLDGVAFLHDNWIIHRDLKLSNILLSNKGILKIADFGLARYYGSPLKPYTPNVVTLWYRAPELLLNSNSYSTAIDMWSVGCIFAEILNRGENLMQGHTEIEQLDLIFKLLGTPNNKIWPGLSELSPNTKFVDQPFNNLRKRLPYIWANCYELLNAMLTYDPDKRISAANARIHPYFYESPRPQNPSMLPTFPALHERKNKNEVS